MGSTQVGGSENSFSEYFDSRTLLRLLKLFADDMKAYRVPRDTKDDVEELQGPQLIAILKQ